MSDLLQEFTNIIKKPILSITLIVLFILAIITSGFNVKTTNLEHEFHKNKEIQQLQLLYCDAFFSRQIEIVVKTYPDLPTYQIKYCILKCKYDILNRLFFSKIQNTEAYIDNLTLSFLNLIWADAFDPRITSENFKNYIKGACTELVESLYSIQEH